MPELAHTDLQELADEIKTLGKKLGFQQLGIAGIDLNRDEQYLDRWLRLQRHGTMSYMQRHGHKRSRPEKLVPDTIRVISARMNYWPGDCADAQAVLDDKNLAYIARYSLGRDYHKVLRGRLKQLAAEIEQRVKPIAYRLFVDSAPVLEKALARNAGLGWIGKHTNLIDRETGSWFLLGEIFTDLALPVDDPALAYCGSCRACLDICPTQAIVAPYELDARRCISYLTIELKGSIPEEFRAAIGNRIFGCDDCQLVCPWNKYAYDTVEADFAARHSLDARDLVELFAWSEQDWSRQTQGSALRRTGYLGWLRNLAIALGNAATSDAVIDALGTRAEHPSELLREHVSWALARHSSAG